MSIFYLIGSYDEANRLIRAKTMLFKVRKFLNIKVLKSIYYDIFDSHLMIFITQTNTGIMVKRVPQEQIIDIKSYTSRE